MTSDPTSLPDFARTAGENIRVDAAVVCGRDALTPPFEASANAKSPAVIVLERSPPSCLVVRGALGEEDAWDVLGLEEVESELKLALRGFGFAGGRSYVSYRS